jgi:hypothetical protein
MHGTTNPKFTEAKQAKNIYESLLMMGATVPETC